MGRFGGSSRGRGFPGRISPGMRPVSETCRMSIADQLEEFQKSEETSEFQLCTCNSLKCIHQIV
jgi:hypothetical protein